MGYPEGIFCLVLKKNIQPLTSSKLILGHLDKLKATLTSDTPNMFAQKGKTPTSSLQGIWRY